MHSRKSALSLMTMISPPPSVTPTLMIPINSGDKVSSP